MSRTVEIQILEQVSDGPGLRQTHQRWLSPEMSHAPPDRWGPHEWTGLGNSIARHIGNRDAAIRTLIGAATMLIHEYDNDDPERLSEMTLRVAESLSDRIAESRKFHRKRVTK